ncbi:Protein of unknown function, partial [Gryllus bimaculatus]
RVQLNSHQVEEAIRFSCGEGYEHDTKACHHLSVQNKTSMWAGNDERKKDFLIIGNAAGKIATPMAIYRYSCIPVGIASGIPND